MPWPKGKPRIGHVNKDGSAHAKKGEKLAPRVTKPDKLPRIRVITEPDPEVMTIKKDKKPIHGDRVGRAVVEPCPNCSFAYADGGYCPECGWTTWRGKVANV